MSEEHCNVHTLLVILKGENRCMPNNACILVIHCNTEQHAQASDNTNGV